MTEFNPKNIGERIYQWRTSRHMTQVEFAAQVGTTPDLISKYETGATFPGARNIWQLSCAMGCTPNDLLGWPTEASA